MHGNITHILEGITDAFAGLSDPGRGQRSEGISVKAFFLSLTLSVILFVVQLVVFIIIRHKNGHLYKTRRFADYLYTPRDYLDTKLWWLVATVKEPLENFLKGIGIDEYFLVRYISVLLFLFFIITLWMVPLLIGINTTGKGGARGLDVCSWSNVSEQEDWRFIFHALGSYIAVLTICWIMGQELRKWIEVRSAYIQSDEYMKSLAATTVLIRPVPSWARTKMKMESVCAMHTGGNAKNVWFVRDTSHLEQLVKKRENLVSHLERLEVAYIQKMIKLAASKRVSQNPLSHFSDYSQLETTGAPGPVSSSHQTNSIEALLRPSDPQKTNYEIKRPVQRVWKNWWLHSVDAIDYTVAQIKQINQEIEMRKLSPHHQLKVTPSCFVQFDTVVNAIFMRKTSEYKFYSPFSIPVVVESVHPAAVIWSNLNISPLRRFAGSLVAVVITVLFLLGWTVPVALITVLAHPVYVGYLIPALKRLQQVPLYVSAIMSGILAPAVLGILVSLIPRTLRKLAEMKGYHNRQRVEIDVQKTLFGFLFIQSFLVVTLSQGITPVLDEAIHTPLNIPYLLSKNLPKASNFFMSYIVIQGLGSSASLLLRPFDLLRACKNRVSTSAPRTIRTPRDIYKSLADTLFSSLQWSELLPSLTNIAVITIIYAPIQPLILPCTLVALACFLFAYRYRLLYCNAPLSFDGAMYPPAILQLFTGLYFMELCVVGRLSTLHHGSQSSPYFYLSIASWIVIVCTCIYHVLLVRRFELERATVYEKSTGPLDWINETELVTNVKRTKSGQSCESGRDRTSLSSTFRSLYQLPEPPKDFEHPSLKARQPTVWLPEDGIGVAARECKILNNLYPELRARCKGASITPKGRVTINQAPPE